ncbi:hypothetical protein Tco_0105132 [Tanacetum coccineum]
MPIRNFNEIAQRLQDIMIDSLPKMVDDRIKKLLKTQVPLHVTQGLILERQQSQADVAKMIADAIQHEYENLHSEISSQINDAITNHIPSQVDSSVRNYVSDHILHVHPTQANPASAQEQQYQLYLIMRDNPQLQQDDLPIWLALKYKFERLNVSSTLCRPSVIRTRDQEDPHNDAYLEGENMQRGRRCLNDDEFPTENVSQELVEEMSQTVDEAKLRKVIDEMLRQQCTSRDEHQYHIDQMQNFLKNDIKGNSGPEKISLSLHKFPAVSTAQVIAASTNQLKKLTRRTFTHKEEIDLETAQTTTTAKLPILKQGEYDMWRLRIEQYFQVQDYALWDVIENGNSFKPAAQTTTNADGTSTSLIPGPVTTKEKVQKKNDGKEEVMLAILGENISQEDLNLKFLRSLPFEWNTHVVVWRNKPDLDTMSFDDLYNNFKIVEQEVKRTASSSSSSSSQNMAFVSSPSSTNEVNTAYGVSTTNNQFSPTSTQVSNASTQVKQIHEDDLEEMDLKWQLALLSMRTRRFFQKTGKKITINGSNTAGYDKSKVVGILDLMRQNE